MISALTYFFFSTTHFLLRGLGGSLAGVISSQSSVRLEEVVVGALALEEGFPHL